MGGTATILLLLSTLATSLALHCHYCEDTDEESNCHKGTEKPVDCSDPEFKTCVTWFRKGEVVLKSCSKTLTTECITDKEIDAEVCNCNGDMCNADTKTEREAKKTRSSGTMTQCSIISKTLFVLLSMFFAKCIL